MGDLRRGLRAAVKLIESGGPSEATAAAESVESVRVLLAERGLGPNCHVGNGALVGDAVVEWYAGQLLDIVDRKAWFAMNSLINGLDKFVPEEGG